MTNPTRSTNASKVKRAGVYVRVSIANRTKHGDTLTFDQDPAVQEQPLRELVAQRGGRFTASIRTEPAVRRKDGPVWTL